MCSVQVQTNVAEVESSKATKDNPGPALEQSQAAHVVSQVALRTDQGRKRLDELSMTVLSLDPLSVDAIRKSLQTVRELSEDLIEDQLVLDKLSNLTDVDRAARKKALQQIDAVLDELDVLKSKLSSQSAEGEARPKSHSAAEGASLRCEIAAGLAQDSAKQVASESEVRPTLRLKIDLDGDIRRHVFTSKDDLPLSVTGLRDVVASLYGLTVAEMEALRLRLPSGADLDDQTLTNMVGLGSGKQLIRLVASLCRATV